MSDIQSIFNPLTQRYYDKGSRIKLEKIYDEIFRLEKEQTDALTKDMIRKMTKAKESFAWVTQQEDHDFLTEFAYICMLCFDVYMRKHMIEKMIDHSLGGTKQSVKNDKSAAKSKDTAKKPESAKELI